MGEKHAVISSRVTQDRRANSRVMVRLDCQCTFNGVNYPAVIVDLSLKGAFLSAKFLPPVGSAVTVTLQTPHLRRDLTVEGSVARGTRVMTEHGEQGRFGIRFNNTPLDLVVLINKLAS